MAGSPADGAQGPRAATDRPARTTAPVQVRAVGRAVRTRVPRSHLGAWQAPDDRADPVEILKSQEAGRLRELLPLRHERMSVSPFAFYRGAAAIMAADLASRPRTGLTVQLAGDAHLANFGGFATAERLLVFDVNDFDETLPGPFEWDVQRLVASFEVAGRHLGLTQAQRAQTNALVASAYVAAMGEFA